VSSWLQRAAARRPDRTAIETPEAAISYDRLLRRAGERAGRLTQSGSGAVALEIEDRVEFATELHACILAGRAAIPIDPRLSESERSIRRARADQPPRPGVLTLMHTSGTTSSPKPVGLTACNWQANALGSAVLLGLDTDERWLCVMPLAHVGGLSILLRSTIYATTVVLHERFETEAVLGELMSAARRITLVSLVPTMLSRLLDAGLRRPPTLRWALLGGGPIPTDLLRRAQRAGVPVAPTYGMTEACSQIATFGWPLPGVELSTRDGELLVRGPIVAPGAVAADGWLHTGDLASFDERGALVIVGRASETIVSGGENVAPAEVEDVLLAHPAVADAGVFGRPDPEWGEAVVAQVVTREGLGVAADELRAFCAERLARFKVPKAIELVDSLPRTQSGKLLRRRLASGGDPAALHEKT
jgi:O-succinylbenzoic acid--CoA ligase